MRKNIRHLLATFGLVGLLSCPENNSSSPVHIAQQQDNTESQARELIDILKKRAVKGSYISDPPALIDNISYKTYLDRAEIGNHIYDILYEEIYDEKVQQLILIKSRIENIFYPEEIPDVILRSSADYPDFPPQYFHSIDFEKNEIYVFEGRVDGKFIGKCTPSTSRMINPGPWPDQKTCDDNYGKLLDEILPVYRKNPKSIKY